MDVTLLDWAYFWFFVALAGVTLAGVAVLCIVSALSDLKQWVRDIVRGGR